jgi:hypothetical protein
MRAKDAAKRSTIASNFCNNCKPLKAWSTDFVAKLLCSATGRFGVLMIKMALYKTIAAAYAGLPSVCYSDLYYRGRKSIKIFVKNFNAPH